MIKFTRIVLYFALQSLLLEVLAEQEYVLLHKLSSSSEFSPRGSLKCQPAGHSAACHITYDSQNNLDISTQSTNHHELYQLQLCSVTMENCFLASTKLCMMMESGWKEHLVIQTNSASDIASFSILTDVPYCSGVQGEFRPIRSTVEVVTPTIAAEPETNVFVKKMEEEKRRKETGQPEDNRSFFAKYWMYIVPALIVFMLASNAEEGGQ